MGPSQDAAKLGVGEGDLKVETEIGWFIDKVWVTEGIKPGIIGCRTTSGDGGGSRTQANGT